MPFERFGDGPHWWSLAAMGVSTLFWLALLGVLVWAASRYLGRRQSEPVPVVDAEPSAGRAAAAPLRDGRDRRGDLRCDAPSPDGHRARRPSRYKESSARGPIL